MLNYKEDFLNATRAFSAPILFFFPFYVGFPFGYVLTTTALLWLMLSDINHILHLHAHHPFFKNKILNLFLDLCMGVVTGMTASNWRIQHILGHHNGPQFEYGPAYYWEIEKYSVLGALSFSLRTIWPIFYKPLLESFRKGFLVPTKHPVLDYRWAFAEQCLLIVIIALLLFFFPLLTVSYILLWYFLVYFVSRYTDYLNHFGLSDPHTKITNNCANKFYNALRCNFGFHTAHHMCPRAHWTTLPTVHASITHAIPSKNIKEYSWSGFMIPYHFYLSL